MARRRWLEWTVLNYEQLAYLRQPPYGDRAIVLREKGELIGSCGLVPCLAPFGQLPIFHQSGDDQPTPAAKVIEAAEASLERRSTVGATPEVGLYYAVSPRHQRRGYATEAARALAEYAFTRLHVARIVATTSDENEASKRVMAKLGMRVGRNPLSTPHWLQVVGILEAPLSQSGL
jgi:RimJ/RimL family protein N-acetyltransferase